MCPLVLLHSEMKCIYEQDINNNLNYKYVFFSGHVRRGPCPAWNGFEDVFCMLSDMDLDLSVRQDQKDKGKARRH